MDRGTAPYAPGWVRRNGVALTILLGLVLIGALAVVQGGVATLAVSRFGTSFNQIANANVPNLIAASELAELSESLAQAAPQIAAADSQTRRQAAADVLDRRLEALTHAIDRIDRAAVDPAQLQAIRTQFGMLAQNLKGLDDFARQRIEADNAFDSLMSQLPYLGARVRTVTEDALTESRPSAMSPADRSRLISWSAAGLEGVTLMLATPSLRLATQLDREKPEFAALIERMERLRGEMPAAVRSSIDELQGKIAELGLGTPNIFDARHTQLDAGAATQTALEVIQQSNDSFVASVAAIFRMMQQDIRNRSEYLNRTVSYFNVLIVATLLLCVAAGAAIFIYVRQAVITRLKRVQDYMRAEAEGSSAPISTEGVDEIAEIAKATQVFVSRIANRDSVLRAIFTHVPAGIIMFDADQRLAAWNQEFARQFDVPEGTLHVGMHLTDLVRLLCRRGDYGDEDEETVVRRLTEGAGQPFAMERVRPNGDIIDVRRRVLPEGGWVTFCTDVTEIKRSQRQLEESERRLRTILEASPIGAAISTEEGRLLFCNSEFAHQNGTSRDAVDRIDLAALFANPDDRPRLFERVRQDGAVRHWEVSRRRADGEVWWCLLSMERMDYEGQKANLSWSYDITELKRSQRQAEESERRLRTVLESSPVGVSITTEDGRILYCNSAFLRVNGMTRDDLGKVPLSVLFVNPEDRKRPFAQLRREGGLRDIEFERRRVDGTPWWSLVSMEGIEYEGEQAIFAWTYDITERKRAEDVVRQKENQLREILGVSPIGVVISGRGGRHLFSNARWRELSRVSDDQVENLDVRIFFKSDEDRHRVGRLLREQISIRDAELEFHLFDGTPIWVLLTMERIVFEGQPATLTWVYDYSERRRVAEELRVARDAAEAAMQAKSTFLATMSHEIRTPMNGVLGMLDLIQRTALNAEQRELTDIARDSASSLLKIIDDILDFSKIEAGRIDIERVPMSPLTIVEGVADALAPQAHKKKLQLATFVDGSVPSIVEGDPVRLRQILFNLIGNALKFTERGEVVAHMSVDSAAPGGMLLRTEIRDTGIGLSPEACKRLFQPFVQADGSTTRRFGGTGLGLSICRGLVERMGGEIGVDSTLGQGTTFWFTIAVGPSAAPVSPEADLAGLCVLAVEDNAAVLELLRSYLSASGAQVEISHTTEAALSLMRRYAAASIVIDAVIVGTGIDGADADAFRGAGEKEYGPGKRPCLRLAAYDQPTQRGQARDAGFAAYLSMPVRQATLLRAIAEACGRGPGLADVSAPASAGTAEAPPDRDTAIAAGTLVLVAEDNPTNQLVIVRQLATLGYAADLASDGQQALELFRRSRYGLVITDIHMPEMDGLELTAAIREMERAEARARVPILAVTADVLISEVERYLAAGIDDQIRKPVSLKELQDALTRWLPKAASARPGPVVAVGAGTILQPAVNASAEPRVLNLDQMRANFGSINGTAVMLLRRFVETTGRLLANIEHAWAERRVGDLRKASHSAFGASRTAGAEQLAKLLGDFQAAIKVEAWEEAGDLCTRLVPALARVQEAVSELRGDTS
jgi:PAS domain S-box-containing protein